MKTHLKETEHDLQVNCVKYFRYTFPNLLIFAIPNGGLRNIRVAKKLKAEGVLKGVPDLFIPHCFDNYNGIFIELKTQNGRQTKEQKEIFETLKENGYMCRVIRNLKDFILLVDYHFKIDPF
jgi:tRNA G26 N,N-dimethylase Trm1